MSEDRDPEATLDEWKEAMQAEHANAIENPDPGADHRIEGVGQVSYRVSDEYDADSDARDAVGERAESSPARRFATRARRSIHQRLTVWLRDRPDMRGVSGLDLEAGEYEVTPAEGLLDIGNKMREMMSSGDGEFHPFESSDRTEPACWRSSGTSVPRATA